MDQHTGMTCPGWDSRYTKQNLVSKRRCRESAHQKANRFALISSVMQKSHLAEGISLFCMQWIQSGPVWNEMREIADVNESATLLCDSKLTALNSLRAWTTPQADPWTIHPNTPDSSVSQGRSRCPLCTDVNRLCASRGQYTRSPGWSIRQSRHHNPLNLHNIW